MNNKLTIYLILFLVLISALAVEARPRIKTVFGKSLEGFTRVKIINEIPEELACYVAIDGRKIKFRLPPLNQSQWYKATDKRFTHKNFSIWCDYIDLHPEFKQYSRG